MAQKTGFLLRGVAHRVDAGLCRSRTRQIDDLLNLVLRQRLEAFSFQAFAGASGNLAHFLKVGVAPVISESGEIQLGRAYDNVLFDFTCLPDKIDFATATKDLELMHSRIKSHPRELENLAQIFRDASSPGGRFDKGEAKRILDTAGLWESDFANEGGGFLVLLILLVVCASGCAGWPPFDGQPHPTTPVNNVPK